MVHAGWEIYTPKKTRCDKKPSKRSNPAVNINLTEKIMSLSDRAFRKCWSMFVNQYKCEVVSQLAGAARNIATILDKAALSIPLCLTTSPLSHPLHRDIFETSMNQISPANIRFIYMSSRDLCSSETCARILLSHLTHTSFGDESDECSSDGEEFRLAPSRKVRDLSTLQDWVRYSLVEDALRCMLVVDVSDESTLLTLETIIGILSEIREVCSPKLSFCVIVEGLSSAETLGDALSLGTSTKVECHTVEVVDVKKLQAAVTKILRHDIPTRGYGFSCDCSQSIGHYGQSAEMLMKYAFLSLRHFYRTYPLAFLCDPALESEGLVNEVIQSSGVSCSTNHIQYLMEAKVPCISPDSLIDCSLLAREVRQLHIALRIFHTITSFQMTLDPGAITNIEAFVSSVSSFLPRSSKQLASVRNRDMNFIASFLQGAIEEVSIIIPGSYSPYNPPDKIMR